MKKSSFQKFLILVILVILTTAFLYCCTSKSYKDDPISRDMNDIYSIIDEDKNDVEVIDYDEDYIEGSYELFPKLDFSEIGKKVVLDGKLDTIKIRVLDLIWGQYQELLILDSDNTILLLFMGDGFNSRTQAANYNFDRIDEIKGREGKYYVQYVGNTEIGKPICLLDKVELDGVVYDREYFESPENIVGTIDNPTSIGVGVEYEEYDGSLYVELVEVLKGQEAKNLIYSYDGSNKSLIDDKEIVMAKFKVYNSGDPYDMNYLNFQYANENLTAEYRTPYLKEIKNELDFTIFTEREAEGWIIFEVESNDKSGYAIFNKKLWFKLF